MSRIQDILARAERDGTARRTQADYSATEFTAGDYAKATAPAIDGTAALDTPYVPAMSARTAAEPVAMLPVVTPPTMTPETTETRTATATLHPALVAAIAPHSSVAEQYRAIRARITYEEHGAVRTVMVTSPGEGEGKSITAANLALTMAQEFQSRVLLVDADLRGPSVQALFGLPDGPGLADVIAGEATLDDALVYLPDYRLTVLTAGHAPAFPTEALGSAGMRRALDTLRTRFDRILLDLPAVMPLADVGTVAPLADAAVMVVRAGPIARPALDQALTSLTGTKVLGVVLNETR